MKTPREILLGRHRAVKPKLDRMRTDNLAPVVAAVCDRRESGQARGVGARRAPVQWLGWKLWRELVWPCRRTWAGLACAWLLIIGLNLASSDSSPRVAGKTETRSREEIRALIEQRRMLAQLIGPMAEPAADRKSNPTGPRSDRSARISAA